MSLIMGVGSGVLALALLLIGAFALCYLGQGGRHSSRVTVIVSIIFVMIAILLLSSPRGDTRRTDIEAEIEGYDNRVTQRALMMSSMTLAIVSAISALGAFHILPPAYAKTIDEHSGIVKIKS